jgi:hypothetical protein
MLMFCGFDLELAVEAVLVRDGGPALCWACDPSGDPWLIVQADKDPAHLAWLCAPVSERALQAILRGEASPGDVVGHSATGTVELVVVEHGRAVPDRCLLCADVAEHLPTLVAWPAVGAASCATNPEPALAVEAASSAELVAS